jgi:hypothetical protein
MAITHRVGLGRNLTQAEVDANFDGLVGDINTTNSALTTHTSNTSNPHATTKTQVGLSNVENKTFAVGIADATTAATSKTTPVDADTIPIYDSAATGLKKLSWSNLKTAIKAFFDSLFPSVYSMPAPTGVTATDDAAWAAFIASSAKVAICDHAGTYIVNGNFNVTRNITIRSNLQRGEVWVKVATASTNVKLFYGADVTIVSENMGYDLNAAARSVTNTIAFDITGMGHYSQFKNNHFKDCKDGGNGYFIGKFGSTALQRTKAFVIENNIFETSTGRMVVLYGAESFIRGNKCVGYNTANIVSQPAFQIAGGTVEGPCNGFFINNYFELTAEASNSFAIEATDDQNTKYHHEFYIAGNTFTGGSNRYGGCGISGAFSNTVIAGNRFIKVPANLSGGCELAGTAIKVLNNIYLCDRTTTAPGSASQLVSIAQHTTQGFAEGCEIAGNTIYMFATAGHAAPGGERGLVWWGTRGIKVHDNTIIMNSSVTYTGMRPGDNHGPGRNDECYNNTIINTGSRGSNVGINVIYTEGYGSTSGTDYADNFQCYNNHITGVDIALEWSSGSNDTNSQIRGNNCHGNNLDYGDFIYTPSRTSTNRVRLSYPDGVAKRYVIGNGSSAVLSITHNLLTRDLRITATKISTNASVPITWTCPSDNQVDITFGYTPTINDAAVLLSDG